MKCYKLTDQNGQTNNNTQWGPNVTHTAIGTGPALCSSGWIHFYKDPLLAVLMNPVHANFSNPKLWEAESSGDELHEPLKSGCKTLTTIKEIPIPEITLIVYVAFGILCAKQVYKNSEFTVWADSWLAGTDRSRRAATSGAAAAYASVDAAADADANAAYAAAAADANAAYAAAYAARAAYARAAGAANITIDFVALAKQALLCN